MFFYVVLCLVFLFMNFCSGCRLYKGARLIKQLFCLNFFLATFLVGLSTARQAFRCLSTRGLGFSTISSTGMATTCFDLCPTQYEHRHSNSDTVSSRRSMIVIIVLYNIIIIVVYLC
uniref:Neurogenic protein mastermind isoform X1 n=1 Tax=Rhizophora mucronata TaxID=61149 RepID=A0A2P2MC94_RHIMU